MKICKFFFFVLVLICPQLSWGECRILACDFDLFNARIGVSTDANETQCWYCGPGPNSCDYNSIVPVTDSVGNIISLYQCVFHAVPGPGFEDVTPTKFCSGSPLISESYQNVDFTNAKKTIRTEGSSSVSGSLSDWEIFQASVGCVWGECIDGYEPSEDKTMCVSVAKKLNREKCLDSHGDKYKFGVCHCDVNKNLEQSTDEKTCVCKDKHTWNDGEQKCVHKDKQGCDDTGGSWDDTNKNCLCNAEENTVKKDNKCECKNSDYGWKDLTNKKQGCSLKDSAKQKQACENAKSKGQDVKWDGSSCKCVNDTENKLKFEDGKCVEKSEYTQCKKLGAQAEWKKGECKCLESNKTFNGDECEYTEEYLSEQEELKKAAEKKTAEDDIKNFATKSLDSVVAKIDRSKWRDIDGNFNTARLASDSVAAVVLGTAGGLISSKVIKKKQVENGFEDIKCTIGNQEVADWGDEFQVGIQ